MCAGISVSERRLPNADRDMSQGRLILPPTRLFADGSNADRLRASLSLGRCALPDKSRSLGLTIFHAITGTIDGHDLGMVQEPIEKGRGKHFIAQQSPPPRKAGVRGQDD